MRQPRQAKALIRVEDERGKALALPSGSAYPAGSRIKVETGHYRASIATAVFADSTSRSVNDAFPLEDAVGNSGVTIASTRSEA